jgi:hypothetical protein
LGHGGAKEGEQEVVPDRCKEEQDVRRIEFIPETQTGRLRIARVATCRQEQGGEDGESKIKQERKRATRGRRGQDHQGAEERDNEIPDGADLKAACSDDIGET